MALTHTLDIRRRNTFSIGLMIALASWALVFITLVWGYVVFRMRTSAWLGEYLTPAVWSLATLNTAVIALSSLALHLGLRDRAFTDLLKSNGSQYWPPLVDNNPKNTGITYAEAGRAVLFIWMAFLLGVFFLIGQAQLWQLIMHQGLNWRGSIAGSFFFLLTGFHALHIVGALLAVFILGVRFRFWEGSSFVIGVKYFWDFLFIVWIVMFGLIFIIK